MRVFVCMGASRSAMTLFPHDSLHSAANSPWLEDVAADAVVDATVVQPPAVDFTVDMDNVLGTGAVATVLRGKRRDGEAVAVKLIPRGGDRTRESRVLRLLPPCPTVGAASTVSSLVSALGSCLVCC